MSKKYFRLTEAQKNILSAEQYHASSSVNNNIFTLQFYEADVPRIVEAVKSFIRDTQALRLVLVDASSAPDEALQYEREFVDEEIKIIRLRKPDKESREIIQRLGENKLDPTKKMYEFCVLSFDDGSAQLVCVVHHLVIDGYSAGQLFQEIQDRYNSDNPSEPHKKFLDYTDTINIAGDSDNQDFWREYLSEDFEAVRLSDLPESQDISGSKLEFVLDDNELNTLHELQERTQTSLPNVIMSLLSVCLSKFSEQNRIAFGTPYFNRLTETQRNTFGLFMTILPFISEISGQETFNDICTNTAITSLSLLRHQNFSFTDIQKIRPEKLYNMAVNFFQIDHDDYSVTWESSGSSQYELAVNIMNYQGKLVFWYDFQRALFDERFITKFHKLLINSAKWLLDNPDSNLAKLPVLSDEDIEVYSRLNDTKIPWDENLTIAALFEKTRDLDKTAIICEGRKLSYKELHKLLDKAASYIISRGIGRNQIVVVAMKRSENFIAAVFGIIKAGAAFLPIDTAWPKNRKDYVIENSQAALVIDDEKFADIIKTRKTRAHKVDILGEDTCYCIYTSGSTGRPKGALISHKNAVNYFLPLKYNYYTKEIYSNCEKVLCISNVSFDVSISEYFLALLHRKTLILASDNELDSIEGLTNCIMTNGAECIQATPSRVMQYLEYPPFIDALAKMKVIVVAAEAFPENLAQRLRTISNAVLLNAYGPTETTIGATASYVSNGKITIGKPNANVSLHILNRMNNIMPVDVPGELVIAGYGVGKGYIGLDELTREKFTQLDGVGRIYHTGDRAKLNHEGEIEFLGRLDRQVKLHGLRVEISEIENVMLSYPGISAAAVRVFGEGRNAYLVGYYTQNEIIDVEALNNYLSENLTYYMIPAALVYLESFPYTTSGKIDYNKLTPPVIEEKIVPCSTSEQEKIHAIISSILGTDNFGITTNLFRVGLTSLLAVRLNTMLAHEFSVEIGVADIMRNPTIKQLEQLIIRKDLVGEINLKASRVPLMGSQLGIWLESEGAADKFNYHLPLRISFTAKVNPQKLQKAVTEALTVHNYLLSSCVKDADGVFISASEKQSPSVALIESENPNAIDFVKPFSLTQGPLYRTAIYFNDENTCLYFDVHHIICDGQSLLILLRDIERAYNEEKLQPEFENAFTSALIEQEQKHSPEDASYYDKLFAGAESVSAFRSDKTGGDSKASEIFAALPGKTFDAMNNFSKEYGVSHAALYLSALQLLLSRYTRNEDIIIAAAENGRNRSALENSVGMYVRTILHRFIMNGGEKVCDMVRRTGNTLYENIAHDTISYPELTSKYDLACEIMLVYQNHSLQKFTILEDGAKVHELKSPDTKPKFPILFDIAGKNIRLEYDQGIFEETSIKRILESFIVCIERVITSPQELVKNLEIISSHDKAIINKFNQTQEFCPEDETIVSRFLQVVELYGDKLAFACKGQELTYSELDLLSNRIANGLINKGVKKGNIVLLQLPRNFDTLPTMLGILKTGAAYLPLNIDYPEDRVNYIREESRAVYHVKAENIDELKNNPDDSLPAVSLTGHDLCYVIYTSGSTGKPKGVMVEHGNVINFASPLAHNRHIDLMTGLCSVSVVIASLTFDMSVGEIYPFLFTGKPIIFADDDEYINPIGLSKLFDRYKIDFLFSTPTRLQEYMKSSEFCRSFKNFAGVILGGEVVSQELLSQILQNTNAKIFNGYGPTETTCLCSAKDMTDGEINIGAPLANVKFQVLDQYGHQMPVGMPGELFISGRGVGRGYLNREDLTAKLFIMSGNSRTYRSGDIVFWTDKGELQYIGRNDFQIKLRGLRIELEEIEAALSSCKGVNACKVLVMGTGSGQYLCAYIASSQALDERTIKAELSATLTEYMIPSVFVFLDKMPTNSSGKIDANALRKIEVHRENVPCENDTQQKIFDIIANVLGTRDFGITTDIYVIGLTSLLAMQISVRLAEAFSISDLSSREIMKASTVEALEKLLHIKQQQAKGIVANTQEKSDYYKLSGSQMGIFVECGKNPGFTGYNIPYLLELGKNINIDRLKEALTRSINAHPYLKAVIVRKGNEIFIKRNACTEINIPVISNVIANPKDLVRPFDLEKGPLYRMEIFTTPDNDTKLFMDFHHIIFDGISSAILLQDIENAYNGGQVSQEDGDVYQAVLDNENTDAKNFYDAMFANVSEGSRIFYDGKDSGNNQAAYFTCDIPTNISDKVLSVSRHNKISQGSVWFSAFLFTVSKFAHSNRVAVGTVENGRDKPVKSNMVGMFVNTLPICVEIDGNSSVPEFVHGVHEQIIEAAKNSAYTYVDFVADTGITLDTHFVYNERPFTGSGIFSQVPVLTDDSRFAFTLTISGDQAAVDYRRELYTDSTIDKFVEHMFYAVSLFADEEGRKISELTLADKTDIQAYYNLNSTEVINDDKLTMDKMFARAVREYSDRVAVVCGENKFTYAALNRDAERIAAGLHEKGIGRGDIVAFCLPRSIGIVQAIFGIIRAGAAILPTDITWPKSRLDYVILCYR